MTYLSTAPTHIFSIYENAAMVARVKEHPALATEGVVMLPGGVYEVCVTSKIFGEWLIGKAMQHSAPSPGTWMRLRSLRLAPSASGVTATVVEDTHAVVLPPYAVDCVRIASGLKIRVDHQCNLLQVRECKICAVSQRACLNAFSLV